MTGTRLLRSQLYVLRRKVLLFAWACLVTGGFVGLAPGDLGPARLCAQQSDAPVNPMMQMANPPKGSGRAGLRTFARKAFDGGNVAWLAVCAIGSSLLIPGGLLLYGRSNGSEQFARTTLLMPSILALLTLVGTIVGYSLSFASNWGTASLTAHDLDGANPIDIGVPVLGGFDHLGLAGVEPQLVDDVVEFPLRRADDQVPHLLFMFFQLAIAVTVMVPLIVRLAPRIGGGRLALVSCLWLLIVYAPAAHWIWGFGWLRRLGALDFGGSAVRHMTIGFSALAAAWLLRPRAQPQALHPESGRDGVAFAAGGMLVCGGEMFINAGGAWSASPTAAVALLNVQLAASAAACVWFGMEWLKSGAASGATAISGALAGLAAISAASGNVAPQSAIVIGLLAGVICRSVSRLVAGRSEADLLSLFAIHGVGGLLGILLVGIFASANVAGMNRFGRSINGLLSGDLSLIGTQATAGLAIAGLALVGSAIILLPVRLTQRGSPPVDGSVDENSAGAGALAPH